MSSYHHRSLLVLVLVVTVTGSGDWNYEDGANGPEHWAEHYPECGGSSQSPINIFTWIAVGDEPWPRIQFHNYDLIPLAMTITNNGHSAQVSSPDLVASISGGSLGGEYVFSQFHFHWGRDDALGGAEHTINSVRYASELHLVHYKSEYGSMEEALNHPDGLAVLGVLLQLSDADNNMLDNIVQGLANIKEPGSTATITSFPLINIIPRETREFYRYQGSLTTPGCNEVVIWTVFANPITVSSAQMDAFRSIDFESGAPMMDNYRPLQPLNDRKVFKGVLD